MVETQQTKFTRLTEAINEAMAATQLPGLAVGVLYQGEMIAAGFGVTNVEHPSPVTADTRFQVGSITKTFTGTLLLRLAEMGKLDLGLPVRHYLPDFQLVDEQAAAGVTLRHLLTHMAGWEGDLFVETGSGDDALAKYVTRLSQQEQLAPLNTIWSYNNAGFSLAGYIIEQITGQSYETVMQELVFDPLGLQDTCLNPADVMTHSFAVGHEIREGNVQVARPWPLPRAVGPAGGIISTVEDLLRYASFHLGDGVTASGERLLLPELLHAMHTQQVAIGGGHDAMGLTWFINHVAGVRHLSHAGATLGQIALLLWVPEHQFALALLTNADRGRRVTREISRFALQEYLGLETVDPAPLALAEAELRPYVGHYVRPFAEVTLALQDGQLMLSPIQKGSFPSEAVPIPPPPPPIPVAPYHPDYLIVLEGDSKTVRAEIIRRPDGSIGWLRWGSRIHEKVS